MAGTTLYEILGRETLTEVITTVHEGLPEDTLPPGLLTPAVTVDIERDEAEWLEVKGTRKVARQVMRGSKSRRREHRDAQTRTTKAITIKENMEHNEKTLDNLGSSDPRRRQMAEDEIARQTVYARSLIDNARIAAICSAFSKNAIYFDGDGNMLPSSSGSSFNVSYNIPAGNRDQLDWDGNGAIIGASWATAGTDIIADMQELHQAALHLTGYPLVHAVYGTNILEHLVSNTAVKELINRDDAMRAGVIGGNVPNGLFNLTWWPGYKWFYEDNDGTNQSWIGADDIIFFPEPDLSWWEFQVGTQKIPSQMRISSDASAAASDFATAQGMYSYAKISDDPATIIQNYGDTFLPVIKVPSAVFIADTTP